MKIFTLKRMIGLAAIAGVVQYARKQGGFRPMLEGLMDKAKEVTHREPRSPIASRTTPESTSRSVDETSVYGGNAYGGFGNNSPRT